MPIDSPFLAFFSYAQADDEHDNGHLSQMRELLQGEIAAQTGQQYTIFQDRENIRWGQAWKEIIQKALDASLFLIPIITPRYLEREACRAEFEYFQQQETRLRRRLILPILYIDTPKLTDPRDPIAVEISRHQWEDWTDLRFSSLGAAKARKKIAHLAQQIGHLIEDALENPPAEANATLALPESIVQEARENKPLGNIRSSDVPQDVPKPYMPPLPSLYVPVAQAEKDADRPPQLITVALRSTGDRERDKLRIKTLHGTLISFHGHDRFNFEIFENDRGYLIDFPNDTTRMCPEMFNRLQKLLGEEDWRIEEIALYP